MTEPQPDTPPALLLVGLSVDVLLAAQLGDERGARRALRLLADDAGRWAGRSDLHRLAPPLPAAKVEP